MTTRDHRRGEAFCGGMSHTLDPHLRCIGGAVENSLSNVPGPLSDRLGGIARPRREDIATTRGDTAGTVLGRASDRVEATVDQVLDILPDLPSVPHLPIWWVRCGAFGLETGPAGRVATTERRAAGRRLWGVKVAIWHETKINGGERGRQVIVSIGLEASNKSLFIQ